jgi:HK97 family phage prohead protease
MPGAFRKTLADSGGELPLLWSHDTTAPIGKVRLENSAKGLQVSGKLIRGISKASEVYELLKEKVVRGMSIGYRTVKSQVVENVRNLTEIRLYEVSLVLFPANREAVVSEVKEVDSEAYRELVREVEMLFGYRRKPEKRVVYVTPSGLRFPA